MILFPCAMDFNIFYRDNFLNYHQTLIKNKWLIVDSRLILQWTGYPWIQYENVRFKSRCYFINLLCFGFLWICSIQFFDICLITKATISVLFICIHIGDIIVALSITLWDQWFSYFNQEGISFICLHVHPVFSMHVINIYWWWTNLAQWFWRYISIDLYLIQKCHT